MEIKITKQDDYALARFDGVLDEGSKALFSEKLHPLIESTGPILIDLSGSDRATSAGLGNLVTLVSRANTKGSRVVMVRPTPFLSSIFHATKLTKFFEIEPTLEAGIARLKQ